MPIPTFVQAARFATNEFRFRQIYQKYKTHTMIDPALYVGNLHLAKRVANVEGAVIECGTWRGGMIAGIADVLGPERHYYLCDSFEGLPAAEQVDGANAKKYEVDPTNPWYHNNCTASEDEAREAMAKSTAKNVSIVKGWFENTLATLPQEPIALLRLDGDWYSSTKCALETLADRVVSRGMILIDDYYFWEGCTMAVNEYAAQKKWPIQQLGKICYITIP